MKIIENIKQVWDIVKRVMNPSKPKHVVCGDNKEQSNKNPKDKNILEELYKLKISLYLNHMNNIEQHKLVILIFT